MDAHELFIRFQEGKLPDTRTIHYIFVSGDVRRLELVALMYAEKKSMIPMDKVFSYDRKKCQSVAAEMLSAIVCRHSLFDGDVKESSDVQEAVSAFSSVSLSEATTEAITPPVSPRGGEHKQKDHRNYSDECNAYFLFKSKTRIQTLATYLQAVVKMDWVKAVASLLVAYDEPVVEKDFELYSDSRRHVHMAGPTPCHFVEALNNPDCKTFSWSVRDDTAYHLEGIRHDLRPVLSKNNPDVTAFVILLCSIGLPTHKMYTPKSFLEHWRSYRYKRLTNANVVRTICRPLFPKPENIPYELEIDFLLEKYDNQANHIVDAAETVETYMFQHWYSRPTVSVLSQLVDSANAIKDRCS